MNIRKAQASIEYLVIIGFVFLVLSFFIILYYQYSQESNKEIEIIQLDRISQKIVDTAEEIYFLGSPSKTTIKTIFPKHIDAIWVNETEITFFYKSVSGISEISKTSSVNLSGTLSTDAGMKSILIEATDTGVKISE